MDVGRTGVDRTPALNVLMPRFLDCSALALSGVPSTLCPPDERRRPTLASRVAISGAPNSAGLNGVGRIQRPSPRSRAALMSFGALAVGNEQNEVSVQRRRRLGTEDFWRFAAFQGRLKSADAPNCKGSEPTKSLGGRHSLLSRRAAQNLTFDRKASREDKGYLFGKQVALSGCLGARSCQHHLSPGPAIRPRRQRSTTASPR